MTKALTTDLYEINMAASYLRRGFAEEATFSLFVRRLPPSRGFLVAAGLEHCLSYLEQLHFDDSDLAYLSRIGFDDRAVSVLGDLRFTGSVWAVPEGRVVLANEPLLEVTAPLAEAQLVETYLLNQATFQTTLATKAARCVIAAGEIELFDFALRRTHGTEAATAVARVCAIAGFRGTSNVEAAREYRLVPVGTMAHSYVEAFPDEQDAFVAFAEDFPGRLVFLVDTYETATGVDNAIAVAGRLNLTDFAVRIDSGDHSALSRLARHQFDRAGFGNARVFVSGGIDEYALARFRAAGDPIDAAGLGMALGVSQDAPTLDSAYKIVELGGRPTMKLSPGKPNMPGAKQVWRTGSVARDVLATRREDGPKGATPLLVEAMRGGRRVGEPGTIEEAHERFIEDLAAVPDEALELESPKPPSVAISPSLSSLTEQVSSALRSRLVGG